MYSQPTEPLRDFESLSRELETLVSSLKTTYDPEARKRLLHELRLMLEKADRLIFSDQ